MAKPKAVVAMSGGVDSSVAAALMKDAGYDVIGIMMKLWQGAAANNESGCCSVDAAEDARRVAQVLDIPFYVFNFAEHFSRTVIADFVSEYSQGRTPNPCVQCNRSVKFATLLDRAKKFGAEVLATGHYARTDSQDGRYRLLKGVDPGKDQSYVLYMLEQWELSASRFPVGGYSKDEIRAIAAELDLRTATKKESQEICFVPDGDSHAFISEVMPQASIPGPIIDSRGEVVGTHRGFGHYTVGQRRGLGIGGGLPLFVKRVDPASNSVIVASRDELAVTSLDLQGVSLVEGSKTATFEAEVMTRYRGTLAPATVTCIDGSATVTFDQAQPPSAPGQAAVFYRSDEVLGGGTIRGAA